MGNESVGNYRDPNFHKAENEGASKEENTSSKGMQQVTSKGVQQAMTPEKAEQQEKAATGSAQAQEVAQEVLMHVAPPPAVSGERGGREERGIAAKQGYPGEIPQKVQAATMHLAPVAPLASPIETLALHPPLTGQALTGQAAGLDLRVVAEAPPDRPKLQESNFETVTKNIPNRDEILRTHGRDKEIKTLCKELKDANWSKIISLYQGPGKDCDLLAKDALKAFSQGNITLEQFCSLTFVWSLMKEFPNQKINVQSLFKKPSFNPFKKKQQDKEIDPQALEAMKQGFYDSRDGQKNFFRKEDVPKLCEEFFKSMASKAPSEQVFFYIEDAPIERFGISPMRVQLDKFIGLRLFDSFSLKGSHKRMIPSFSMVGACVDAYAGVSGCANNTIAPCPKIGLSTRQDLLKNARERGRDVCVPFPGVAHPQKADGFPTNDFFEFFIHDVYHCLVVAIIPDEFRQEAARLADDIAALEGDDEMQKHKDELKRIVQEHKDELIKIVSALQISAPEKIILNEIVSNLQKVSDWEKSVNDLGVSEVQKNVLLQKMDELLKEDKAIAFMECFLETLYGRMVDLEFGIFHPEGEEEMSFIPKEFSLNQRLLVELSKQIYEVTPYRMCVKLRDIKPDDKDPKVQKWIKIQSVNFDPVATSDRELFKLNEAFYKNPKVFKMLVQKMQKDGFFKRFQMTDEELEAVFQFTRGRVFNPQYPQPPLEANLAGQVLTVCKEPEQPVS